MVTATIMPLSSVSGHGESVKSFSGLYVQETDKHDNPIENKTLEFFERVVRSRLIELKYPSKDDATAMYDKF